MSYTLTVEPDIVRSAETFASKRGTSLEAIIRAYLVAFVRTETAITRNSIPSDSTVGALTGIVEPSNVSDEEMIASAILEKYGALEWNADLIITRDKIGFANCEIPVLTPSEFLLQHL